MDKVEEHFDRLSGRYDSFYKKRHNFYYSNLKILLSTLIPKNMKVCEIGCGTGELLNYLKPKNGYGMDISKKMIERAKSKYAKNKNIIFSTKYPDDNFNYVFMSDVIEHLEDPLDVFKQINKLMDKQSIFINTMANPIWEPILMIGEKLGYKMPEGPHYRMTYKELSKLMDKAGLKIVGHGYKLLMPIYIPILTNFINKYLEKYLKKYAFIEYIEAKKK